jgi:hypothetical protein
VLPDVYGESSCWVSDLVLKKALRIAK